MNINRLIYRDSWTIVFAYLFIDRYITFEGHIRSLQLCLKINFSLDVYFLFKIKSFQNLPEFQYYKDKHSSCNSINPKFKGQTIYLKGNLP